MEGVFTRRKTIPWLVLPLLNGIFFIALYIGLIFTDPEATGELLVFLILGILLTVVSVASMLMNHGAYIRVEGNTIRAKYHWFGRLDCTVDEVAFVLPQVNTLTILLKSGKRHVIAAVANSWQLSSAIRRQGFALETESPDVLRQKLSLLREVRRQELRRIYCGIALMFAIIFITVLLTAGRDLPAFGKMDWILFAVMCFLELLTVTDLLRTAERCGKQLLHMEQLKHRLRGAVIASHPLPSNITAGIFTDEDYTGRIVVCGFPNDESVYYCVQEFAENFELETVYTSEIYENEEKLPGDGFSGLIDITSAAPSR